MTYPDLAATGMPYRTSTTAQTDSANPNKLWLPIWSGEVIHAYDEYNMFEALVTHRTIPSGASLEFPITGTVDLKTAWAAGEELTSHEGTQSTSTSFTISLDARPMAAHFEMDNIDLMITQWEYRAELARQAGLVLANTRDKQLGVYILRAAFEDEIATDPRPNGLDGQFYAKSRCWPLGRTVGEAWAAPQTTILGESGNIDADDITTGALTLLEQLEEFAIHLQTINAPADPVYCCVDPRSFQQIRALGVARVAADINDRPFFGGVAESGGLGVNLPTGLNSLTDSMEYMGITIIKSNHMPNQDYNASNIGEARYNLDLGSDTVGVKALLWQPSAVAALSLQGLKVDTVDDVRRNTTFTVASMMAGTGVLRPELAGVITDSTGDPSAVVGVEPTKAEIVGTVTEFTAEYVQTA